MVYTFFLTEKGMHFDGKVFFFFGYIKRILH